MSFRFVGSNSLPKSRTSGSSLNEGETFVDEYWQDNVTSGYEDLKSNPSLNAGQQAILEQNQNEILNYLYEVGSDYDPDEFIESLTNILGDDKFNALSITFEEFAEDISDDWDNATGGDGYGAKKFLGVTYN